MCPGLRAAGLRVCLYTKNCVKAQTRKRTMDFETTKPQTLQEAVDLLLANFTEEDRRILKLHGATMLHHGFGTALQVEVANLK